MTNKLEPINGLVNLACSCRRKCSQQLNQTTSPVIPFAVDEEGRRTVDGRQGDIKAAARQFAPNGVEAVFALAGGKALTRCLDAPRNGGRLGYPNGIEPEPRKRRGIKIVHYDARPGVRTPRSSGRASKIESSNRRIVCALRSSEGA